MSDVQTVIEKAIPHLDAGKLKKIPQKIPLKGSIFIATRTGGMAKTTTAQIIDHVLSLGGISFKLVSLDVSEKGATSKLKDVLPETRDVVFAASMDAISKNPQAALQNFDELGEVLVEGGHVFDFGANVAPVVFGWATVAELQNIFGDIPKITLVVPVTAQTQPIKDALEIIRDARKTVENLPIAKIIIIYNERDGQFGDYIPGYAALKAAENEKDADSKNISGITMASFVLPRLESEIWNKVQSANMKFADILSTSPQDLSVLLDLGVIPCGRGRRFFSNWLQGAVDAFNEIGLIP